jgi:hypothetical protein
VTVYHTTNTARKAEVLDQDKAAPRSSFQDLALLMFYIVVIAVSMGGWLWLLGSLSWSLAAWVMG